MIGAVERFGFMLAGAGIAVIVCDTMGVHTVWSYGGAMLCLGILIVCLTWLERI